MSQYLELHSRSAFSFLEGASLPEKLIETCADLHMPAMALLDRDGVYGAPRFHMAAKKAGVKAHIGAEITCDFFHYGVTETWRHKNESAFSVSQCLRGEPRLPLLAAS